MSQRGDWTWVMEFYQRVIDQKWQRKKKSKEHWYQKASSNTSSEILEVGLLTYLSRERLAIETRTLFEPE